MLLATCRELLREGSLMRGKSNFTDLSERYVFLLTDMLLVAQVGGAGLWWAGSLLYGVDQMPSNSSSAN